MLYVISLNLTPIGQFFKRFSKSCFVYLDVTKMALQSLQHLSMLINQCEEPVTEKKRLCSIVVPLTLHSIPIFSFTQHTEIL